jgi:two-component system sensor histidine kinase BaeS
MSWPGAFLRNLRGRFVWKLMVSYLVVILVGVITLTVTAESVMPAAFNRHMMNHMPMPGMMMSGIEMTQGEGGDLYTNFRAAVTEALAVATAAATISAVVISLFVSWRIVTPIRQMMQASRRIAAGHYRERVQAAGADELGQLALSFNQMAASLDQTETMRRDLIANVAHELRTPLTAIKGYMEGLIDGVLPAQVDIYQQVYREADRLQRLVSDLQELSRVEAGAYELHRHPLAIAPLIRQVANRLQPQFEEKGVKFHLELASELPLVLADEDRLSQVLLNLVGNALQYTPAGGTVILRAEKHATDLLVIVQDTGLGIPAEHLPHLFTRFYRVDKSRSRAGGGSGIGLTIVKHLVEAHGGQVGAASEGAGFGSTFSFSLPVSDARVVAASLRVERGSA